MKFFLSKLMTENARSYSVVHGGKKICGFVVFWSLGIVFLLSVIHVNDKKRKLKKN